MMPAGHDMRLFLPVFMALSGVMFAREAYVEEFESPGKPEAPSGMHWSRKTQLSFPVSWEQMIPGDGYARLSASRSKVDAAIRRGKTPFQTLSIGPVEPGTRLTMRAKNTAVPGLVGLFFTFFSKGTFDEIDIEIVEVDTESQSSAHGGGWTNARFNTWAEADQKTHKPGSVRKMPLRDAKGTRVSHRDGGFHIYSIEWMPGMVRFFVDGVEQARCEDYVPHRAAMLIFGFRHTPWAGEPDWQGTHTMLVDWIRIEPIAP